MSLSTTLSSGHSVSRTVVLGTFWNPHGSPPQAVEYQRSNMLHPQENMGYVNPHLKDEGRFNGSGRRNLNVSEKSYTDADVPTPAWPRFSHVAPLSVEKLSWWRRKTATGHRSRREQLLIQFFWGWGAIPILSRHQGDWYNSRSCAHMFPYPIGSMSAIYGNIYHQYTPNVSIYTIHGSYGYGRPKHI